MYTIRNFYVYGLIDPRSNKPFYIGKGTVIDNYGRTFRRMSDHLSLHDKSNKFKNSVIEKILNINLKIGHIIYEDYENENDALTLEMNLISIFGRRDLNTGILTNLTDGGEGMSGYKHSDGSKLKQSIARKRYYETHEANFKGCKHSEDSKVKVSQSLKRFYSENGHPSLGTKRSEEHCKRQSERQKGVKPPKEICHKFASHGSKNCFAKTYTFISPNGESFTIKGEFKKFIISNNLSLMTCKKYIDKGKIPPPINPKHNKLTLDRINTTGWEILKHIL